MSDIASEIAAEHEFGMFECRCGHPVADWDHLTTREMRELHTAHIVRVAEAAVRARIAADIEAHLVQHFADPLHDPEHEWHEGYQRAMEKAATGAREGAIPEEEPWP